MSTYNNGSITVGVVASLSFQGSSYNNGDIAGDVEFMGSSYNKGDITGNVEFMASTYDTNVSQTGLCDPTGLSDDGSISGTVTFSSSTPVKFTLRNSDVWLADSSAWVFTAGKQRWEFNDNSKLGDFYDNGAITGNCVFLGGSDCKNFGTIVALHSDNLTAIDVNSKTFTLAGDKSSEYASGSLVIAGSTANNGTYTIVSATLDSDHTDIIVSEAIPDSTVDGYTVGVVFAGAGSQNACTTIGNCLFGVNGGQHWGGTINGNCDFSNSAAVNGIVNGNCIFRGDGSWHSDQLITGTCEFRGIGSYNSFPVVGNCLFTGEGSYNKNSGQGVGVTGNCTFSGMTSYNEYTIEGDCVFSGAGSYNDGTITGNAEFSSTAYNTGGITGTLTAKNTQSDLATIIFNYGEFYALFAEGTSLGIGDLTIDFPPAP